MGPVTCEIVQNVSYRFHPQFISIFWDKIYKLPTAEWTKQLLDFTYNFYMCVLLVLFLIHQTCLVCYGIAFRLR